jgi:hypothetical protein
MTSPRRIEVDEIVKDVRDGLTDHELMKRYGLSAKGLKSTLQKLVDAEIIQLTDVYRRPIFYEDGLDSDSRRESPRHYLSLLLPVYDAERQEEHGWVTDISEQGIGVMGVKAVPGEKRTLVVIPEKFSKADQIVFEAECHWAERESAEAEPIAGFRITAISDKDLEELRRFIRVITIEN